jgi:uncharacterized protein (TIGR00299 family) protein
VTAARGARRLPSPSLALHLHLDPVGGIAGDMFIAAVTDAFPSLRERVLAAIAQAGVPDGITCSFAAHADHGLTGSRFVVDETAFRGAAPRGASGLRRDEHVPGAHGHRDFADIREHLARCGLAPEITQHALAIFTSLAEVEGRIHGVTTERVSFHELGEWDSIADIVGAACLIDALGGADTTWSIGALPLGGGFVRTAHGPLPVPTPATARLLEGFTLRDDGVEGERVTPTGAAIAKYLCTPGRRVSSERVLTCTGYGFGTKRFPGLANTLRVTAFAEAPTALAPAADGGTDQVAVLAFEVDDQTPEDLALGLERLRAHPAVRDVLQMSVFGKKGRIAAHVQVLADPEHVDAVADACFVETATLGLRVQTVLRRVLPREMHVVDVEDRHGLRVKVAQRPDGTRTAKVESHDLRTVAGAAARARVRTAAQSGAIPAHGTSATAATAAVANVATTDEASPADAARDRAAAPAASAVDVAATRHDAPRKS